VRCNTPQRISEPDKKVGYRKRKVIGRESLDLVAHVRPIYFRGWLAESCIVCFEVRKVGILNELEGLSGQQGGGTNAKVASGLMQALDEHAGGLSGVLDQFRQNGMSQHVQSWASGQQQTATPEEMQQGLGGTGLIDTVAAKAGVSPATAKMAMAVVLPIVIAHFTQGGQQAPPQSGFGGMPLRSSAN
jgi:uncharacterized protein YidB (DUF937 family)